MERSEDIPAKLEKLEKLFARGATPGECAAAGAAWHRLTERLKPSADEIETELHTRSLTHGLCASSLRDAASMA
jgi:hypothetical protein